MEKQMISLRLNLSLVDAKRLYRGKKGEYLDAVLFLNPVVDQYGNNGFIVESVSAEERKMGHRGTILGNAKILGGNTGAEPVTPAQSQTPKPWESSAQPQYRPPMPPEPGSFEDSDMPF